MPEQASPPVIAPSGPVAAAVEAARIEAVRRYDILDTPPDGAYDRIARLAARWFDVPVATVTIVDEDRIWFKATHGLDGVSEIGRDPGLCGSAVLADDTYVVTEHSAGPARVRQPAGHRPMGVRFYAAAPIITSDGHRLGTVNVIDTRPREIDEAGMPPRCATWPRWCWTSWNCDSRRCSVLRAENAKRQADEQAAGVRNATRGDRVVRRHPATHPRASRAAPRSPGWSSAALYRTASAREVGGDFYDVFPLSGGRWAVRLGDVCGKGAEAASVTSFIRYTLRAAALVDADPTAALKALNTALLLDAEVGTRFCTAVFGLLDPAQDGGFTVTLATGGHPPAYHLSPAENGGVRVEAARAKGGMLVGAFDEAAFASLTLHLAPGEGLLLYTRRADRGPHRRR